MLKGPFILGGRGGPGPSPTSKHAYAMYTVAAKPLAYIMRCSMPSFLKVLQFSHVHLLGAQ